MAFFDKFFFAGLLAGAVFGIGSCTSSYAQVKVIDDNFQPLVKLTGNKQIYGEYAFTLNAGIDRQNGKVRYGVYMTSTSYTYDWHRWNKASASNARELVLISINRDVHTCGNPFCYFVETVGVLLPEGAVEAAAKGEVQQIKLFARSGETYLYTVEPAVAAALTEAVNAQKSLMGPTNAR